MPRAPTLTLAACLPLTACGASVPAGLRIDPLPVEVQTPCAAPSAALGAGDWEIIAGRLGDALIVCEGRRVLAATAYENVRTAVRR